MSYVIIVLMIKMVTLWLISFEELWFSINALFHISIISTQDLFRSPNIKYLYQRAGVNEGKYSSFFFLEYPFFRLATSILNFNPNNLNTFLIPFLKKFLYITTNEPLPLSFYGILFSNWRKEM